MKLIDKRNAKWKLAFWGAAAVFACASTAQAAPILINGGFETTTPITAGAINGELGTNLNATGWTLAPNIYGDPPNNHVDLIFNSGANAAAGVNAPPFGTINLLGIPNSPSGGNFAAIDADETFGVPLFTNVTGLTVGQVYTVTFDFGASQFVGAGKVPGAQTLNWAVSLGGNPYDCRGVTSATCKHSADVVTDANGGFSGWKSASLNFTATSTSAALNFLAVGPSGFPPFLLLDNVQISQPVPEPASIMLLGTGLVGLGRFARRRLRKA
jgi:PEP-CTERM motif